MVSVSPGLTPSPAVSKSPSFSVSAPWSPPAALVPSVMVISIKPSVVSPSLSMAVTFKSILVDSLSPWSIGPVTVTSYDPSVAMVTVITGLLTLSTTVIVLPETVNVVASPLLVMPVKPG
ncbi:hypothetical protein P3TCK_06412 [Photobacterium profundum 3TCK]|uniref:Uncharacterized protein n=1 Tax=Photobacterium profundum 3TCK TaxID=314280 RepID=Q1Z6V9_9GAMM|nr:hypothetical protein P3TCK_06412 [Photobacterium profundum 3TCK]